jgi:hypothetical protein
METIFFNDKWEQIERTACEIYTRVMWYHRPVSSFNIWKKSEFYSRTYFKQQDCSAFVESNNEFLNKYS